MKAVIKAIADFLCLSNPEVFKAGIPGEPPPYCWTYYILRRWDWVFYAQGTLVIAGWCWTTWTLDDVDEDGDVIDTHSVRFPYDPRTHQD